MNIINGMIQWFLKRRIHQIELFKNYPYDTQFEILTNLLYQAKDTVYGKKYQFSSIGNYEDFKNRVPLVHYEDFEPYIERARKGEKDVTWTGKIKWFAKSSGTTNAKSKFIPVSDESLEDSHYKAGKDLLSMYINNHEDSQVLNLKNVRLGGSSEIYEGFDTKYGDLSAILIDNLPFWAELFNVPDKKVSLMTEWETKLQAIINQVKNEDVASLTGVPSWMLVLLQQIQKQENLSFLDHRWKNVEVFFYGGINFSPYRKQSEQLFEKKINFYEIYNASEGFFAFQDVPNSDEMLLLLDYGIFFEFIPMEEFFSSDPKVIPLSEVELNKNYALVITTNGGLWRYIIGDTVKFTSLTPHRIKITGRTKHYINAFGEELMIDNAETALKITCEQTEAIIKEYTAAPIFLTSHQKGKHQWLIEFVQLPTDIQKFATILDEELKKINSDYEAKRYKNMTLELPEITLARQDLFFDWMKNRGKLGGQNKVPRLANNRDYIDDLLKMGST